MVKVALRSEDLALNGIVSYRVVHGPSGGFRRGGYLETAVRGLKSENSEGGPLIFLVDVDMIVSSDFFHRCRANAVAGRRAYFPIPFSVYHNSSERGKLLVKPNVGVSCPRHLLKRAPARGLIPKTSRSRERGVAAVRLWASLYLSR